MNTTIVFGEENLNTPTGVKNVDPIFTGLNSLESYSLSNPQQAREAGLALCTQDKDKVKVKESPLTYISKQQESVWVYYNPVVINGQSLQDTLDRRRNLSHAERFKTKHRMIVSKATFLFDKRGRSLFPTDSLGNPQYCTSSGEPNGLTTTVISACAPNLRFRIDEAEKKQYVENPVDYTNCIDRNRRLIGDNYKQEMKRIWAGILYVADQTQNPVLISPMLGCGAYTRNLLEVDQKLAVQLAIEALIEALKEQKLKHIQGFVLSIPRGEGGKTSSQWPTAQAALEKAPIPFPICLTDAGMIDAARHLQEKGIATIFVNPSSDHIPGGGYLDANVKALEEQLFGLSTLSQIQDAQFNSNLAQPDHHYAISYTEGYGYQAQELVFHLSNPLLPLRPKVILKPEESQQIEKYIALLNRLAQLDQLNKEEHEFSTFSQTGKLVTLGRIKQNGQLTLGISVEHKEWLDGMLARQGQTKLFKTTRNGNFMTIKIDTDLRKVSALEFAVTQLEHRQQQAVPPALFNNPNSNFSPTLFAVKENNANGQAHAGGNLAAATTATTITTAASDSAVAMALTKLEKTLKAYEQEVSGKGETINPARSQVVKELRTQLLAPFNYNLALDKIASQVYAAYQTTKNAHHGTSLIGWKPTKSTLATALENYLIQDLAPIMDLKGIKKINDIAQHLQPPAQKHKEFTKNNSP